MEFTFEPMINFRTWKFGGGIWATKLNSTDSVDKAVWILRGLVKGLVKPLLNHTPDYTNKGKNTNKVCSFPGTGFHTAVHKRPNWPFVKWFHVNSVSFNWWWAAAFSESSILLRKLLQEMRQKHREERAILYLCFPRNWRWRRSDFPGGNHSVLCHGGFVEHQNSTCGTHCKGKNCLQKHNLTILVVINS